MKAMHSKCASNEHGTKHRGFTLIELLVVISIIGLLSTIVVASLNSTRVKARDAHRVADLNSIRTALELFYDKNGYYPQSSCGWDCNAYKTSYTSNWDSLKTDLAPYLSSLPKDPINSSCTPWNTGCYSYSYGNVGRTTYPPQYDLTAQLEDSGSPYRCAARSYRFYFDNQPWCGPYSPQVYEASL